MISVFLVNTLIQTGNFEYFVHDLKNVFRVSITPDKIFMLHLF